MNKESWLRLSRAMFYYQGMEFNHFDASWTVKQGISAITKPNEFKDFFINDKVLVGSAEQSFLSMYDSLDKEIYYAITPCFRDEIEDELHQNYFMKLELFSKDLSKFNYLINSAFLFFSDEVENLNNLEIVNTVGQNKDIFYNGIEIGSYNYGKTDNKDWICGTGLAEPRFTIVNNK